MEVTLLVNTNIAGVSYAAGSKADVSQRTLDKLVRLGSCAPYEALVVAAETPVPLPASGIALRAVEPTVEAPRGKPKLFQRRR